LIKLFTMIVFLGASNAFALQKCKLAYSNKAAYYLNGFCTPKNCIGEGQKSLRKNEGCNIYAPLSELPHVQSIPKSLYCYGIGHFKYNIGARIFSTSLIRCARKDIIFDFIKYKVGLQELFDYLKPGQKYIDGIASCKSKISKLKCSIREKKNQFSDKDSMQYFSLVKPKMSCRQIKKQVVYDVEGSRTIFPTITCKLTKKDRFIPFNYQMRKLLERAKYVERLSRQHDACQKRLESCLYQ